MIRFIDLNDIDFLNSWLKDFDSNFSKHYDLKYYLDNKDIYV